VNTVVGSIQAPADEHAFLIGRPPMGEFFGFIEGQTIEGQNSDRPALAAQWRNAHARIQELESTEAGLTELASQPLPTPLQALADELLADPVVRKSFGFTVNTVEMVELDRLVVFQKYINMAYVRQLQGLLGDQSSAEDLFRFALPISNRYDPTPRVGRTGQFAWTMVSPSNDFRVLETVLLDPSQISGLSTNGMPTQIVATVVGYGTNLLSASRVAGRLVLRNGSHRAVALRASGHTHVPMLISELPKGQERELFPEIAQHYEAYVEAARPPMLRDYFDEELRMIVHVPRTMKQLRVTAAFDESYTPGL
jgi:hypothetical protein